MWGCPMKSNTHARAINAPFEVGDRVRHIQEGDRGRIYGCYVHKGTHWVKVHWEGGLDIDYPAFTLELNPRAMRPASGARRQHHST
jgi:hypothetical protein